MYCSAEVNYKLRNKMAENSSAYKVYCLVIVIYSKLVAGASAAAVCVAVTLVAVVVVVDVVVGDIV